jgi:hypothetical protein
MAINTGVNISKYVAYAVLGVNPGVNVSKQVGYAVLGVNSGVNITKQVGYAVLGVNPGINIAKQVGYAVFGDPGGIPVWPSFTFANGVIGVAYSQSFTLTGSALSGLAVQSGSLPTGLSLSKSGNTGTIGGTPTVLGTFSFTLRATNAFGTADQAFSITIVSGVAGETDYGFAC